ncbi:MAG: hypothetical protein Q8N05_18275, partial [Bacteroidota bacterium]|nr:hypothetical protein [Bacteroidota bacterium]
MAQLDALRERVANKGWLELAHNPDDGQLIDRIVASSELLNDEQHVLFGKLIDSYLYVREIVAEVHALWLKIREHCPQYDRVYIAPLRKKDEKRTKSGDSLCYF